MLENKDNVIPFPVERRKQDIELEEARQLYYIKANHYDVKIQGVKKKDVNAILKYIKVDGGNYDIEDIDDDKKLGKKIREFYEEEF